MEEIKTITSIFGDIEILREQKRGKSPRSEREWLVELFCQKLSETWKSKNKLSPRFVGIRVSHLKLPDLYYLKSMCDTAEKEGRSEWSKVFWGSLKVK